MHLSESTFFSYERSPSGLRSSLRGSESGASEESGEQGHWHAEGQRDASGCECLTRAQPQMMMIMMIVTVVRIPATN